MNRLSTEIDENITQRLDKKDLSALLKTSRYHRTIAEPYLYGELTFSDQQHASISLLLNTILDRRELAGRIRSFTLTDKEHTNTFSSTHSPTSLWPRLAEVKLLLEEFVPLSSSSSSSSRLLAKRWLQQLLAYAPVIDGKVAMIICLAKEINDITLSTSLLQMPIMRIVIGWPWIEVDAIAEEDHSTSLTLEIYNSSTYHTQLDDPFPRHPSPPLTDATDNGKKEGEQAIRTRDTYRMKQMDDRDALYPFHKLKRLSIHDPKRLASYKSVFRSGYPRRLFQSFESLCSLTTLTIDDELIDLKYPSLLVDILTSQVLPTRLQSLSITSICYARLAQLCQKHTTGEEQDVAIKCIVNAVTALRLERFELHTKASWHVLWADYMRERDESIHRVVPVMIDALNRCGTTMRVWHQGVSGQTLWYEPGFAVAEQDWD
ncbi:unnamed protein product [Alternaria burnsii]|nr:unnamed protein product [Alternaria burnsii]